jgi:hypothetical protein
MAGGDQALADSRLGLRANSTLQFFLPPLPDHPISYDQRKQRLDPALRETDARYCQLRGAWQMGVHHDLSPFGLGAAWSMAA